MWKWLERPAAKVRRTLLCDVSMLFNANQYESAWRIQRHIDVTKSKIRLRYKVVFRLFVNFLLPWETPGAAQPWSQSSCREGDAEAQRSFRWLTIPTAGAVRADWSEIGWLPNIIPLGDIKVCSLTWRLLFSSNHWFFRKSHKTLFLQKSSKVLWIANSA